jgi:hypothetical protein
MTTREELNSDFEKLESTVLKVKRERDALLIALLHLLHASPTSCEDKSLIDAQREAEALLKEIGV